MKNGISDNAMTRLIDFVCTAIFMAVLWVLILTAIYMLWLLSFPETTIDPDLWQEYKMTDLRGH